MTSPDDYLYDRGGPEDADVARLERAFAEFRPGARSPAARSPESAGTARTVPSARDGPARLRWLAAGAAAAAALVGAAWFASDRLDGTSPAPAGRWVVASIEGAPRVGARALAGESSASAGETLETDAASRARVDVADLGHVEVGPSSRVRLLATGGDGHRILLDRGRISALTWAPPRMFFVETPTAVAADLGCSFTLDVDDAGVSHLVVTSGWVALERGGIESVVPAGAECRSRRDTGPGTPCYTDAPEPLKAALARVDAAGARAVDVDAALAAARARDAFTVWHLIPRTAPGVRSRVYERLAALSPPPAGVTREAVLALEKGALTAWRETLP